MLMCVILSYRVVEWKDCWSQFQKIDRELFKYHKRTPPSQMKEHFHRKIFSKLSYYEIVSGGLTLNVPSLSRRVIFRLPPPLPTPFANLNCAKYWKKRVSCLFPYSCVIMSPLVILLWYYEIVDTFWGMGKCVRKERRECVPGENKQYIWKQYPGQRVRYNENQHCCSKHCLSYVFSTADALVVITV